MAEKRTTARAGADKADKGEKAEKAVKAAKAEKAGGDTAAKAEKTVKAAGERKTTGARTTPARTGARTRAPAATAPVPAAARPPGPVKRTLRRRPTVSAAAAPPPAGPKSRRRTRIGMVVSAKSAKTVIVEIERLRQHPLYRKAVRIRKRFAAHDEAGDVRAGDLVRIQESRPYSATKRWRVLQVLSRAGEAGAAAPKVADVEKALEQSEGVTELLARPEAPATEAAEPKGEAE